MLARCHGHDAANGIKAENIILPTCYLLPKVLFTSVLRYSTGVRHEGCSPVKGRTRPHAKGERCKLRFQKSWPRSSVLLCWRPRWSRGQNLVAFRYDLQGQIVDERRPHVRLGVSLHGSACFPSPTSLDLVKGPVTFCQVSAGTCVPCAVWWAHLISICLHRLLCRPGPPLAICGP